MNLFYAHMSSPVGHLMVFAHDAGVRAVLWEKEADERVSLGDDLKRGDHPVLAQTIRELGEYFEGQRTRFSVPLDPQGTEFQKQAWMALRGIPYGETRSYSEQAQAMGRPKAVRAVGAANGRNPISIIVPCHRVIGKSGDLTGFGGGLAAKRKLLEIEAAF